MTSDFSRLYEFIRILYARAPEHSRAPSSNRQTVRIPLDGGEIVAKYGTGNPLKGAQKSQRLILKIGSGHEWERFSAEWGYTNAREPYVSGNLTLDVCTRVSDMLATRRYVSPVTQE